MLKESGISDENFLERNNNIHEATSLKIVHLTSENSNLQQYLSDLQGQLHSLRLINKQLQQLLSKNPRSVQNLVQELTNQNANLQKAILRIIRDNSQLSSDVLMKSQIITQNQNQFRQILSNYQNKIYELRTNLQGKQGFMACIENKNMAEKGEIMNVPSKANILSFNEINQLRFLNEGYHIQNITLQLLVSSKNQQLQQTKRKLKLCEDSLKKGLSWATYNVKALNASQLQKTKQKSTNRLKLEQQLTKYDNKYKHISSQYKKSSNVSSQMHNLKLLVCQLYNDIHKIQEEKQRLQKMVSVKDRDLHNIKICYRQLEMEMKHQKVEVDFYRLNFKELTKVTTQQKIKFYEEYYEEDLPLVKKSVKNLNQIVASWKEQHKSNCKERRMLSKFIKKSDLKHNKRSLSCIHKLNVSDQNQKKTCKDLKMQNSILSFINESDSLPSIIEYSIDQKLQNKPTNGQQNISFGEEISQIQKVIKTIQKHNKKGRKQFFLKDEL